MSRLVSFACLLAVVCAVCVVPVEAQGTAPGAAPVTLTLVHLNDVYEIRPVEGGKSGGLSRVATVIKRLKETSPQLLTTLGGDFLSPTVLGTAKVDGKALAGKHMVDVLNAVGVDWATFGNHEFDLSEEEFRARMAEAKFHVVSTNVTDTNGKPFDGVPTSAIVPVTVGGRTVRLGIIGVTVNATKKPYVKYRDPIVAAQAEIEKIRRQCDAIVALTHLSLGQDADFITAIPDVDVVLGGHEHENWLAFRGPRFVPIIKADANVRSLAIVSMTFGAPGERPVVSSRLQIVDRSIPAEPDVDALTMRWAKIGFDAFRREGFEPDAVVATTTEALDGRESTVRNRPGLLTDLIVASMAHETEPVDVAIFNGGSVRIDDVITVGPVTEYDIIRILPFGGKILKATFDGALLTRVLDTGMNNQGLGGYLHPWGARWEDGSWRIGGKPIDPAGKYTVALPEFLLTGGEINMGFLTRTNPSVSDIRTFRDLRRAVIEELARRYPPKK
jgi:5'-nucleotidase